LDTEQPETGLAERTDLYHLKRRTDRRPEALMKARTAAGCLLLLCSAPAYAQNTNRQTTVVDQKKIDPAKEAAIRKLQELRGDRRNANQLMDTMVNSMKPLMTKALPPGEYRDQLIELFFERLRSKNLAEDILDEAVPIYDRYLSADEIRALIEFYESPVGRKLVDVTPQLMAEVESKAQKHGEEVGRQSMLEVLAEHPDLAQSLQEAAKSARSQ